MHYNHAMHIASGVNKPIPSASMYETGENRRCLPCEIRPDAEKKITDSCLSPYHVTQAWFLSGMHLMTVYRGGE